jgi:hypothetical protein
MPSKGGRLIFKSTTRFHVGKSGQRFCKSFNRQLEETVVYEVTLTVVNFLGDW